MCISLSLCVCVCVWGFRSRIHVFFLDLELWFKAFDFIWWLGLNQYVRMRFQVLNFLPYVRGFSVPEKDFHNWTSFSGFMKIELCS